MQFQAPSSATWCRLIGDDEILRAVPTGDGHFALYSPHFGRYMVINPRPDQTAGNCNPLAASATDISQAARFTATGLDRNIIDDFLEVSGNASGLSFAGMNLADVNLSGYNLSWCDFTKVTSLQRCNHGRSKIMM